MPIDVTRQPIKLMRPPNGYYQVASLEDIKRVLRESNSTPVVMVLTQDIIIDGATIKA